MHLGEVMSLHFEALDFRTDGEKRCMIMQGQPVLEQSTGAIEEGNLKD